MLPIVTSDLMSNGWELMWYTLTTAAALVSYLFAIR
jgi:hypothetical protein